MALLKNFIWIICFPLIFPAVFSIPFIAIYMVAKYVFTGKEDPYLVFVPMEWIMNLPDRIIDQITKKS